MSATTDRVERQRLAAARRSALLPAAIAAVVTSSLGLSTAFQTYDWFPLSLVAVLAAFGLGRLSRRLDVPGPLAPAVSMVGFVVLLGLVYYRDTTMLGIPSGETIRGFGESLRAAMEDIRILAPPVEATESLTILTACGVFLVAVMVDSLVFRTRRPVLAGLPLLALYVVPASLRDDGVGALTFAIAAAGYIALLIAEGRERAKGWGRRLAGRGVVEELVDVSPVARVGRRLGAVAVSLAIVVPAFVPDLGDGLMGGLAAGGSGFGDRPSSREVINPIVELKHKLHDEPPRDLFEVETTKPEYLRLTSLDLFDGHRWSQSRLNADSDQRVNKKNLPRPFGLDGVGTEEVTVKVFGGALDASWLPAPFAPQYVEVKGDWRYDDSVNLTIFSSRAKTFDLDYTVRSLVAVPSAAELDAAGPAPRDIERFAKPPANPPVIAQQILADLDPSGELSPYYRMVRLQEFFTETGGFVYDMQVSPGTGTNHLERFLDPARGRRGYCEQFAAAMAYLARLDGLPARVAIGFTPGRPVGNNRYVVTNRHAHAWPEVYFDGAGWVRFEPTPRNDGIALDIPDYSELPASPSGPDPSASPSPAPTTTPGAAATPSTSVRDPEANDTETPDPAAAGTGGGGIGWWMALWLVVAAFVVSVPAQLRVAQRALRRRRATTPVAVANAAWCDLADDAEDLGYPLRDRDSPRAAARRLAEQAALGGDALDALTVLGRAEERARYARTPGEGDGLGERVKLVRRALAGTVSGRRRLRAALLPAATLRRARDAVLGALQRFGTGWSAGTGRVSAALPLRRGRHSG